jgi:nondiscriminating aspartyl-tRNA synthetase
MSAKIIHTNEMTAHQGQLVRLQGHVQSCRDLGNLIFIALRDQRGIAQAVVEKQDLLTLARALSAETPVRLEGLLVATPKPKYAGDVELAVSEIVTLSERAEPLPVEIHKSTKMEALSLPTMFDYRPLTLRNEKAKSVFKVEAVLCRAFREFLTAENFVEIHSPKLVSTGTEGGAQLFQVDYFGRRAYLAQSPQFYKQIMVGVFERVFEIGPVYRAEDHETTRHINEYVSMDLEMGFIESEQDLIQMQIRLLKHMFWAVKEKCERELTIFGAVVPEIEMIPQIRIEDAFHLLKSKLGWKGGQSAKKEIDELSDLDPESERLLCRYFKRESGSDLLYITRYPHSVRPFYAMPIKEVGTDGKTRPLSLSFDLLFAGQEVTTGGQRIHRASELIASIEERGLNPHDFEDYLQCFRYGMPPHGGLAIGLERLTKQLLNLPTIKLASLFPRDCNRLTP